jgi:hypothetical protein
MKLALLYFAAALACACTSNSPTPSHAVVERPASFATTTADDFAIQDIRKWCLIGNDLTPGHDTLALSVAAPAGVQFVDVWLSDSALRLTRDGNTHRGTLTLADLEAGEYTLRFTADGSDVAFGERSFTRTHPLYVLTSTDWDTPDNADENLERHVELHRRHNSLKITHLVGPYTFTDLSLSEERVEQLIAWCVGMREDWGDEIGVHIHPYRTFIEAAGAEFHAVPTGSGPADPTGYGVNLSVYEVDELTDMFELTVSLFEEMGLGRPTSFRAGAWNADIGVMRALANAGFLVDTSALNVARLEEWQGTPLYDWVTSNWPTIDDRSQPYYMNRDDVLSSAQPQLPVLQLPDNGVLVDYVSAAEMIEVFRANWPGGALATPTAVSIGWHPPNFGQRFFDRIDEALTEFDLHLAENDDGPVIYANLSDMVRVWKQDLSASDDAR